jgi:hypothetical protein
MSTLKLKVLTNMKKRASTDVWGCEAIDKDDRILNVSTTEQRVVAKFTKDKHYIIQNYQLRTTQDGNYVRIDSDTQVNYYHVKCHKYFLASIFVYQSHKLTLAALLHNVI